MNYNRMKTKLLEKIDHKRHEMIETANKEGYTSETAVKCSQDLDLLINEYQLLLIEEKKSSATRPLYQFVNSMKMIAFNDRFSY
ncbi:aspartyl-phosphate phosphatase Spo0E family protein [Metabacillus litoralis]|uniref:Aspartyl-phosphate phosphatase Spo0E family protein n=1 Tax=Metabacillus litoralis TaxID=152268 RepID=A0A5C6W6X7_9BACI|nr:aspartyl-phosphate phosphatase Spo0E family protein [Metabacillus litoralis]TXC91537.1 aspartyl-phosphate phosphatase Spo0E family protein [Metabacillus litoralis]